MKAIKTFQFTLVLKKINEETTDLEDSLYEAGCDDALINFRNRAVFLDFDRESFSLEEAVISAIRNVKAASVKAEIASISPGNLVTESEIAKRIGKSRQTVSLWIKGERRGAFPYPIMRLSDKSHLWNWSEVCVWLFQNKIITDKTVVDNALFFANINAALEESDKKTRIIRNKLLKKIAFNRPRKKYG